jgi:signal recognition particle receptor subunit beta
LLSRIFCTPGGWSIVCQKMGDFIGNLCRRSCVCTHWDRHVITRVHKFSELSVDKSDRVFTEDSVMAQYKYDTREIIAKLVYYGPSCSGKTTNLQWLHCKLDPRNVGQLFSLETQGDRTLFFDLLPLNLGKIRGMDLRLKIYTVPGEVKYNTTRKMVLSGADAVVFVADSDPKRHDLNVASLKNLADNLVANGLHFNTIPLVFQYNKRDLPQADPIPVLDKKFNDRNLPSFGSVAIDANDYGVLESFIAILSSMVRSFGEKYQFGTDAEITTITNSLEKNLRGYVESQAGSQPRERKS